MEHETNFLHGFFHPQSVAVVGASRNPTRIGHHLLGNLVHLGFQGRIYPIHPEPGEMLGLKTYSTIQELPEVVDLAVIGVSHELTPGILQECARKGVKRVVLVAGGFSETGEQGKKAQSAMKELLGRFGMRAVGPNALSPINSRNGLAVSFHPIERIEPGGLCLIFQSGLYEPRLEFLLGPFGLRLNKLLDLGNKMDINEVEALSYMYQDPHTRVIGIHLESAEGGAREFLGVIREAARKVPVVVLKSGRTEAGVRAAASHTGVMAGGNDALFDAALRQAGAIRAQGIEEFFDICKALERLSPFSMKGPRVALATLPGGEGVIVTDLCEMMGLRAARISDSSLEKLRPVFPGWEIGGNPFDLGVSVQFQHPVKVYQTYLQAMLSDPQVDAVAVMLPRWAARLPQDFLHPFQQVVPGGKPVVVWVPGMYGGEQPPLKWMEDRGIPVFPSPEKAIRTLAALYAWCRATGRIQEKMD
ncbi:MAG: CoA-binding protein [bacterium]